MEAALSAGLPRLSPSQQDCHDDSNISRAEHELHRATDRGGPADLALWAGRWGQPLIDAARDPREVEDDEPDPVSVDTSAVEAELDELQACIDTAIENLSTPITAPEAVDQLKDALTFLGKARTELEKL